MDFDIIGLVAVILLFGGPLIAAIAYFVCQAWVKVANHEKDVELKHRMLEAGMSVDEIERIMAAGRDAQAASVPDAPAVQQTFVNS